MNTIMEEAITESISGLISEHRAKARADGTTGELLVRYPTSWFLLRVNTRIESICLNFPDVQVEALDMSELTHYLPTLGVRVLGDEIELRVIIPPPRTAHARPPSPQEGRFHQPGEIGFAGMTTYHCPKHGNVILCACKNVQPIKKYRIIIASDASTPHNLCKEFEADTSEEVWEIVGKECPLFGIYEVRDNLTNEVVPEFIPF